MVKANKFQRATRTNGVALGLCISLSLLRVLICLWPQTGYLHPDEFFQSTDIAAGKYYVSKIQAVWEFTTDQPIRCMLLPQLLNTIAFKIVDIICNEPSAYLLLVMPRIIYLIASFSIDYSLSLLCQYQSSSKKPIHYAHVSIIFQSSFVCLSVFTRTLSNNIEAIVFAWLLVVVCRNLFADDTKSSTRMNMPAQIVSSAVVGFLVTLGTFNRPTFPAFALVPCLFWLHGGLKQSLYSIAVTIKLSILPAALSAIVTFVIVSCYDTIYYKGYETVRDMLTDIVNLAFEDLTTKLKLHWVVTPYNFIAFNTNYRNLSRFGIHEPYVHALINMPLAFNLLAFSFYRKLVPNICSFRVTGQQKMIALMSLSTLVPIILLSIIPHQEFRFLAPLIIPLVYTYHSDLFSNKRSLLPWWFFINLSLASFYATVHQSGVTNALLNLDTTIKDLKLSNDTRTSLISSGCYPAPTYLLNIGRDDDRFHLDFRFDSMTEDLLADLDAKFKPALDWLASDTNNAYSHKLFIILPSIDVDRWIEHLGNNPTLNRATIKLTRTYSPHFSGENLRGSIQHIAKHGIEEWRNAFGLSLVQVDLNRGA